MKYVLKTIFIGVALIIGYLIANLIVLDVVMFLPIWANIVLGIVCILLLIGYKLIADFSLGDFKTLLKRLRSK